MVKLKGKNTRELKVGTTLPWDRDREIAQKTSENVMPNIPGAYIREKRRGKLVYYYLVKTYRTPEGLKQKTLRYYGVRPPRGSK